MVNKLCINSSNVSVRILEILFKDASSSTKIMQILHQIWIVSSVMVVAIKEHTNFSLGEQV
jgi:hypothetical protein